MRGLLLLALWAGPAAAAECPFPGQAPHLLVQMYFGQSLRGHGLISRRAWERFVADTVTPALPGGFTVLDAHGQWQDAATGAIGREPTEVLLAAVPDGPEVRARVAEVAAAFRRRFDQRSVGVVTSTVCAAF